jgi:ABC-type uncharacterized transport system substrate-binding protein
MSGEELVMRYNMIALPFALLAAPALAQPAPQSRPIEIPSELTDPAMVERIAGMTEALSRAMLDLPIGEIEAAAEGRAATAADRRRKIRDLEPDVERKIAESGPRIRAAMQGFSAALPAITEALAEAAEKIERAAANMPQPGYPKY